MRVERQSILTNFGDSLSSPIKSSEGWVGGELEGWAEYGVVKLMKSQKGWRSLERLFT